MSDLSVVAVLVAKPGYEILMREALTGIVVPTRDEEGCRSYSLYESASVPGTFITVESWREQADLDAHMQTQHISDALAAAGEAFAAPPAIHVLTPIDVQ